MWKTQLRTNTVPTMRTNLRKPPLKPPETNCYQEFKAMKGKIESKLQEIAPNSQVRLQDLKAETLFTITGLNKYFHKSVDSIPDEFFCKVLDSIKNITVDNDYRNPNTFEFQYLDNKTGELKDDTFYVFYGISYEPSAMLSYFNYSAIYLTIRSDMSQFGDNLVYMDLGFKGRDGYSYIPAPNFNKWKWW